MLESETKQSVQEDLHQEIKTLREILASSKQVQEVRTRDEFKGMLENAVLTTSLQKDQIEGLTDALYPLFRLVDFEGKTVVLEIPAENGKIPDELRDKYSAYIGFLLTMGAKSAVFIEKGIKLDTLSDNELEKFGLRRI